MHVARAAPYRVVERRGPPAHHPAVRPPEWLRTPGPRRLGGAHVLERHGGHVQRLRQVVDHPGAVLALQHFDVHLMFPASSKIGMYMSTTTRPTARPRTVISSGSKARVNQSTKRATSSS